MKKRGTYFMGGKWCNRCKDYHPLHEFGINKNSKDGKAFRCNGLGTTSKEYIVETPILTSQYSWSYQRPDYYDLYISKTI